MGTATWHGPPGAHTLLQVRLVVPGGDAPAGEVHAVHPALPALEHADPRVRMPGQPEPRELLRPEVLAEQRQAEQEVQPAVVGDEQHALVTGAGLHPLAY